MTYWQVNTYQTQDMDEKTELAQKKTYIGLSTHTQLTTECCAFYSYSLLRGHRTPALQYLTLIITLKK